MANLRETELYKKMDSFTACSIVEGFSDTDEGVDNELIAWQYIWDTGLWKGLQGFYGRGVHALIQQELIEK